MGGGIGSIARRLFKRASLGVVLVVAVGCATPGLTPFQTISDLVKAGRINEAVARVQDTREFPTLVRVRTAREFEVLWTDRRTQPVLDPETLTTRMLASARAALAANPGDVEEIYNVTYWLRLSGRNDEAVETARFLPAQFLESPANAGHAFVAESLALSLVARGDVEEGVAIMRSLAKFSTRDKPFLINQFLNFGEVLVYLGRNEEAIQFADMAVGPTSEYGRAVLRMIRTCALHRMGQAEAARTSLNGFLDTENQRVLHLQALICMKDFDTAAAAMRRSLEGGGAPQRILTVLLQDCTEGPELSPLSREYRADLRRVRDRPDVRPTVDRIMIILKYPAHCI